MKRHVLLLVALCWTGFLYADETNEVSSETGLVEPLVEAPAVVEEPVVTEEPEAPMDEPGADTPVLDVPQEEDPATSGEEEPIEPPVKPTAPKRPIVDPQLRNMYLGNSSIGSTIGPRVLKKPGPKRPEKVWKSEVEVGATGYRGNTDSEFFLLKLRTEKKRAHGSVRFGAKGMLGNKDGERDRENVEVEAAMRNRIEGRWYYTAEARYFTDEIADVDYQVVTILSPGYEFIQSDNAHLSLELGPAYIAEKKGGIKKDFAAVRLAVLMDKLIDDRILIWERIEYLPAIEDAGVYLVVGELGVESILTNWFSLRTVLQIRYDSNPAEDKEMQDIFLSASLVTSF